MITVRKASERGHADHGWLNTYHTFSFADYFDEAHMGFRNLRVINEDRVSPGQGFGTHPHRDMEIITYVLEGELEHRDSMGTGSVIRPGEVQHMSAGTGVTHSEFNHSQREPVHFLQIWIVPDRRGVPPGYHQRTVPAEEKRGRLRLVASPDGADESLPIHADARLYASLLAAGETVRFELAASRSAWIQVARGALTVNGAGLEQSDGAAVTGERHLEITATRDAELLLFDLA